MTGVTATEAPPATAPSPLLAADGVTKTYRRGPEEVHALRGVTFDLFPHEVVGLVGPSGSGKTTLLNVLCGWEGLDSGSIRWNVGRRDVPARDRPWREIGILPQRLGLIEELTVRENVALPSRLSRRARGGAARADDLLEQLGLATFADRLPAEVSIGEQQRTALACALALRPGLLLADEPTGHQDEEWAKAVFGTIRWAAEDGTCCLVATHNAEIAAFADRVLGIRDGLVHPESTVSARG
jgi:putative ABC transport system ATP-binding protein